MTTHIGEHQEGERAPADVELILEFVNTNDLEGSRDELATAVQMRDWLVKRGLAAAGTPADEAAHARALAVREGIRALGRANNQEPMDAGLVLTMNEAARRSPVTVELHPLAGQGAWHLEPAADGIDAFLGRVLGGVAHSMADGSWSRVKACRNDTCRWLFYDHSRNRSGTWCTMAVCGSRMKARAYRARQRESATA